jgi:RNA polymerase sigma-70 factor, ECF subfamily
MAASVRTAITRLTEPAGATVKFADVYEDYFAFVWRTARRLGVPDTALEDVTQEIFMVVHRKLPEFEGRSTLKTWLFSVTRLIVRRQRSRFWRSHAPRAGAEESPDLESDVHRSEGGPHDLLAKREAARVLAAFLESLDDDKREVFILAELEQMHAPEIATALGLKVNTVYSRLRLAREAFSSAVARYHARERYGKSL